jgi:recombination protein RecT
MLGKKSAGFMTSITTVVQNNDLLQKAEVNSIILAAAQAASLDLPINPNLGFSAIIPFNDKKGNRCVAQFQIMRDGWVDLCLRTGQFEYIANEIVYEGELVEKNRFTDTYIFDETKRKSNKIIGYMASFKLVNGYRKTLYMTVEEAKAHGKQYSQTFKKGYGLWADNFNAMALKTTLKMLLKKFAPKSIESIAKAIESDQASFVGDIDNAQAVYVDNQKEEKDTVNVTDFVEEAEEVVDTTTGEVLQAENKEVKDKFDF